MESSFELLVSKNPQDPPAEPSIPTDAPALSFPTSYLGESFKAHATLRAQQSHEPLFLRVFLQTPSQHQFVLAEEYTQSPQQQNNDQDNEQHEQQEQAQIQNSDIPPPLLLPLAFDIKELGIHSMLCLVSSSSSSYSFRQYYSFNVINPLSVKTKSLSSQAPCHSHVDPAQQTTYLEVQVQNSAKAQLSLTSLTFQPTPGLTVTEATSLESVQDLIPQDLHKLLFILKPVSENDNNNNNGNSLRNQSYNPTENVLYLGSLNITWNIASTDQSGRLQTSTLSRRLAPPPPPHPSSQTTAGGLGTPTSSPLRHSLSSPVSNTNNYNNFNSTNLSQDSQLYDPSDVSFFLSIIDVAPVRKNDEISINKPFRIRFKLSAIQQHQHQQQQQQQQQQQHNNQLSKSQTTTPTPVRSSSTSPRPGSPSFTSPKPRLKNRVRTGKFNVSIQHIKFHTDFKKRTVEEEVAHALLPDSSQHQPPSATDSKELPPLPPPPPPLSPSHTSLAESSENEYDSIEQHQQSLSVTFSGRKVIYPPPFPSPTYSYNLRQRDKSPLPSASVIQLGESLHHIGQLDFTKEYPEEQQQQQQQQHQQQLEHQIDKEFELEYLPLEKGVIRVGGIRILAFRNPPLTNLTPSNSTGPIEAAIVKELDIATEVLVS